MTPGNLFRCGLTCDYTMECLAFLRECFDIEDPDPACTPELVRAFCDRMRALFCKGYILGKVPAQADPAVPAVPGVENGSDARSVSQIVFEQVDLPEPILVLLF